VRVTGAITDAVPTRRTIELQPDGVALIAWTRAAYRTGEAVEIRMAASASQAELAWSCGLARSAVASYEARQRSPRTEAALRLGKVLKTLQRVTSDAAATATA
jgi:hypothetical protein